MEAQLLLSWFMADVATFLKESSTKLGIFYPNHYIVATLPSDGAARQAESAIRASGIPEEDVLSMSPDEMRAFLLRHRDEQGVTGNVMTGISRALGDDATFVDDDLARAERGAGFLLVHCPSSERVPVVKDALKPYAPVAMHWYRGEGIESLI